MKTRAMVLGCGLVGATMAKEMAADSEFEVGVADLSLDNLHKLQNCKNIATLQADLGDPGRVHTLVRDCDIVLGALPSHIGLHTLEAVIRAGKHYCDISFMSEDALELDGLAKEHGVTAIVDCGVSPGLSSMMVGFASSQLERTERADIYVGGLPKVRRWPYQYKAPFAPSDVIEEYVRPARMVENGKVIVKPALSDPELMDFPGVGTLEAFNTDGLRSLLKTIAVANMREKTLRFPGHIELMRVFRETGFFDRTPIELKGASVRPRDVIAKLLFPHWTYEEGEEEFTILRVTVEGRKAGKTLCHTYDLYDEYDRATRTSSMARTTAFPNVIAARMIAAGRFQHRGVFPPELVAREPKIFDHVLSELAKRAVRVSQRVEER